MSRQMQLFLALTIGLVVISTVPAQPTVPADLLGSYVFSSEWGGSQARSNTSAANSSWRRFYTEFRAAVNKRDRTAMLGMMPGDFFDGGGGFTAREWLQFIDENDGNGSWRDLQKSFAQGTVVRKSSNGKPTRVTRDRGYYFEYRKNKRWYFAGVVGD